MADDPQTTARVAVVDAARLDDCRALWLALRDHHGATDPGMGPLRADEDSWGRLRARYAAALTGDDAFLILAEADDAGGAADGPLACALVMVRDGSPTWAGMDRHGELNVLAVAPGARGLGIGAAVVEAVRAELDRRGAPELRLVVTAGNLGAQAFYRELGLETYALLMRRQADETDRQGQDT